jgi:oligosaccharide repeat unit polymerase
MLFKQNILSPTVIACGMFIVSTSFAILNVNTWKFTISSVTVVVIITSLIAFGSGEFIVHLVYYKRKYHGKFKSPKEIPEISMSFILAICILLGIMLVYYYHETLEMAKRAGYKEGQGLLMLAYARKAYIDPDAEQRSRLASYSYIFIRALSYTFSFIILYNYSFFKKIKFRYILPILIYLPFIFLSTARTDFISLIAVWFIIGSLFFMQKKRWSPLYAGKIIRMGILLLGLFSLLFVFSGSFKDSRTSKKAWSIISFYTGMSIPSLDNYIMNPRPKNSHFGNETLSSVYDIIKKLKIMNIPDEYKEYKHLEFTSFSGVRGNVYTVIRRLLQDYGFLGLYLLLFFFGFLYAIFFEKIKTTQNYLVIIYSILFYPVIMMSIDEQFIVTIISISTIYTLILLMFNYYIFINRKSWTKLKNYCFRLSKIVKS